MGISPAQMNVFLIATEANPLNNVPYPSESSQLHLQLVTIWSTPAIIFDQQTNFYAMFIILPHRTPFLASTFTLKLQCHSHYVTNVPVQHMITPVHTAFQST